MQCRLCNSIMEPFTAGGLLYGDCPVCGYIQIDAGRLPGPRDEQARYELHHNSYDDRGYTGWIGSYLDRIIPVLPAGGTVLDFGSGPEPVPGRLLSERGFDVCLYDPYFAPATAWRNRSWQAIMLHEVAEHLAHPAAVLSELRPLLAPKGALCLRTRFAPDDRTDFEGWWYRMDSTHVGFFRERTIRWIARYWQLQPAIIEPPDTAVLLAPAGG